MRARLGLASIVRRGGRRVARAARAASRAQSPQTFRASTDVVMVDVSVRKGNTPVTGLTAADFDLRDNGVRQEIETVESKAVPIDLSIIVDVSGEPQRPWVKPTPVSKIAGEVDERVRQLTELLRDGDRVRLFAVDTDLQQVWSLQPAGAAPSVRANLNSTASRRSTTRWPPCCFSQSNPPAVTSSSPRRRAWTRSVSMTAAGVRAIAERSDAQMHLVMQEMAGGRGAREIRLPVQRRRWVHDDVARQPGRRHGPVLADASGSGCRRSIGCSRSAA